MGEIVLTVVIILGIIIAGGFLIFFLGDLLMSIIDPKGEAERIKNKKKDSAKKYEQKISKLPAEDLAEIKENNPEVNELLAEIAATDAEAEEFKPQPKIEAYKVETVEVEPAEKESEEDDEEKRIAEARAALEKRKEEILKRMQEQLDEEVEEEETVEEEEEVPAEEETVEIEEEKIDENAQIKAELEEARKALAEERARYEELSKQIEEAKQEEAEPVVVSQPAFTKEEYEAQLVELEARLKNNEKELKACKKEYLPLARINKTLARDEKKLNRKEAIVAKQKLVLYGVNNYEDLDEEKAKKLAEDLDLYDGLKLSVQHGQEVMEKNKDRFPVLEKMYFILKNQNEEIRKDIASIQANLKILEEGSPVVITDEESQGENGEQSNQ